MATTIQTSAEQSEQRVLLRNVSWETYEALLAEVGDHGPRLTYDQGDLELMSPSNLHEWFARLIDRFIGELTLELNIPIRGCRSTTLRNRTVRRGLEADDCYYVQNEPLVRGKVQIDLTVDPPPDLAVEIDITSSSLDRMGIYAALRVPELWRFDGESFEVYRLEPNGKYVRHQGSVCFPFLPLDEVLTFLARRTEMDETSLVRVFREWVRDSFDKKREDKNRKEARLT